MKLAPGRSVSDIHSSPPLRGHSSTGVIVMKALLAAFTLLSFLAASTVPMIASAEEMNQGAADQTTSPDNKAPPSDKSGKTQTSTKHAKDHKTSHKKTPHQKSTNKKTSKKKPHHKTAKKKTPPKDTGKMSPPKAG